MTLIVFNRHCARVVAWLALALCSVPLSPARAAPSCMESSNQCEPDKLCTFKAQLAEKVFLYQMYLKNSQVTKKRGKRDGVRYDGALYDASIKEAREAFPNASSADQMVKAGQIFQEKMRKYAADNFKLPTCSLNGNLQRSMLPKEGYSGMFTDDHCRIRVNYEGGDYEADGFGASHGSCQEFYDRDRAHEVIHQQSCEAAKAKGKDLHSINAMIEDEIAAYAHSVRLSQAYVRLLSIRCSAEPDPKQQQERAKRVQDLLAPYLKRGQ